MGGDVALTLGRHHPDRASALVVTGYSPFAAAGDQAAEMAAWASDLSNGMVGFVAGYERRHGPLPEDARARWLSNDAAALAACVASMIAESDGSQVNDLPDIQTPVSCWWARKNPSPHKPGRRRRSSRKEHSPRWQAWITCKPSSAATSSCRRSAPSWRIPTPPGEKSPTPVPRVKWWLGLKGKPIRHNSCASIVV